MSHFSWNWNFFHLSFRQLDSLLATSAGIGVRGYSTVQQLLRVRLPRSAQGTDVRCVESEDKNHT